MNELLDKIKEKLKELSDKGIPILLFRDPIKKSPSVSLTMMILSLVVYLIFLIKESTQADIDNSFQLLLLTVGLYFSRSFSVGKHKVDISNKEETK